MRTRRILFSLVVVALFLVSFEFISKLILSTAYPAQGDNTRSIPLPAPGSPGADGQEFLHQLGHARRGQVQMIEDERTGWTLPPSSVRQEGNVLMRINELGLRGPQVGTRQEGEVRLLTLGDSSIFGVEVEEKYVFSTIAANDLHEKTGKLVTPFIGGVPGFDSWQALERLNQVGPVLKADWVVIGTLWSDVFRNDQQNNIRYRKKLADPMSKFSSYQLLKIWLSPYLSARKVGWINSMDDIGHLDDEGLPPRTTLKKYVANLRAMAEAAKKYGGKPAFLILPAPMDFDTVAPPETVQTYRAAMAEVAQEVGAPLVNGPEIFLAKGKITYFNDQVHPSREGHALIGHSLADVLLPAMTDAPKAGPAN